MVYIVVPALKRMRQEANLGYTARPRLKWCEPQWLTLVIIDTQKAEIRRMEVGRQPRQRVHETLS
jgi:hypothetical protein